MGRRLENKNATATEIELYRYTGMYLVEATENYFRYAPVHFGESTKDFPFVIEDIEDDMIEWDQAILFDKMACLVKFQGKNHLYDADILAMLLRRAEELQFEKPIFDGIFGKREAKGSADEQDNMTKLQLFVDEIKGMANSWVKKDKNNEFCFDLMRWSKEEPYWCVFACEHKASSVGIQNAVTIGGHFCIGQEANLYGVLNVLAESGWKVVVSEIFFRDFIAN